MAESSGGGGGGATKRGPDLIVRGTEHPQREEEQWYPSQAPPMPGYPPPGSNYPSNQPSNYPSSNFPSNYPSNYPPSNYHSSYAPQPPPQSQHAPPPLGFRPPPPPVPLGSRPAAPPPPPNLGTPGEKPSPPSKDDLENSESTAQNRAQPEGSQMKKVKVSSSSSRSRWDKKTNDGEASAEGKKVPKIKMGLGKRPGAASISMKLKPQVEASKKPKLESVAQAKPASSLVAQAFGDDSDDDEEEMPAAAKLRMRNMGRDTPTSSGPNSFYKTAKGFTDPRGSWRNELDND